MIDLPKLEEQVRGLMFMQNQLEEHLSGEKWRNEGHNYKLCIVMEACEAIDHYGWKHWKAQESDIPAAKMELVDILHFWLAMQLTDGTDPIDFATDISYGMTHTHVTMTFVEAMSGIIGSVSSLGTMPIVNFFTAMKLLDMDWEELHMLYVCKNTLNVFRRDNGYDVGTYIKDWDGVEDNVHADALARAQGSELMVSVLYDELKSAYKTYALNKQVQHVSH